MKLPLPPVYPITDRRLAGTDHAAQVRALASAGARFIQLREKELPDDQLYAEARSALEAAVDAGVTLIINDRVDLAVALKAPGVHLGQSDLTPDSARRLLGPDAIIGFSTHNIGQVREAVKMPIDYLAFGPIFPTSTKEDPDPVTGIELLEPFAQTITQFGANYPASVIPAQSVADVQLTLGQAWSAAVGGQKSPQQAADDAIAALGPLLD